ncbi:ArsR family transcriptional regulator [Gordonia terrae]|uniref:ArsR family transcriptional regulator n=1 Tax=Gordonia terrae TaxID=2055 RepID=A0A2I1R0M2_9ACTN|nr:MarR family transcriptional regulator [Gordonia terrae]PKZ62685.1 ArsR family transcriptional regulator [Gordonia terrae]
MRDRTRPTAGLAARLADTIGPLRRALLRSARAADDLPDIPDAQVEVLRILITGHRRTERTPSEIASHLRLARPTVSNLLGQMVRAGLVQRAAPDTDDKRRAPVVPTERAVELLTRFDAASEAVLRRALTDFTASELSSLESSLDLLDKLSDSLVERLE